MLYPCIPGSPVIFMTLEEAKFMDFVIRGANIRSKH